MTMWVIRVTDDTGVSLIDLRVPDSARHDALVLALAILETARHHLPSNGAELRLVALQG